MKLSTKLIAGFLGKYGEIYGYYDVFIVCAKHGHVMYTWAKEADFGTNLGSGEYRDSHLAETWRNVVGTGDHYLTDTKPYVLPVVIRHNLSVLP